MKSSPALLPILAQWRHGFNLVTLAAIGSGRFFHTER